MKLYVRVAAWSLAAVCLFQPSRVTVDHSRAA